MSNHNEASANDFDNEIGALNLEMEAFKDVTITSENAEKLRDIIARSAAIAKRVEEARKKAKDPHWEAGKKVDKDYKVPATRVVGVGDSAKALMKPFLIAEKKKAEEKAARLQEEAAKANRLAERLKENQSFGEAAGEKAVEAEKQAVVAEKAIKSAGQVQSHAGISRVVSLRQKRWAKVIDSKKLVEHYRAKQSVIDAAITCANAEIRASRGGEVIIPGVEVITEQVL